MGKTLLEDTTGFNPLTKAANALEERWHNEGVTKGIQHKAVLGLFRHLGSPEGMFTFMPTGMAHQLKPTDPMVKEIIGKLEALTSVSPRLKPSEIKGFKELALQQRKVMKHMRTSPPNKFSAKYKDNPTKYIEDMLEWREKLGPGTPVFPENIDIPPVGILKKQVPAFDIPAELGKIPGGEQLRRMDDVIRRLTKLEATPRTPHMGKVRSAESFLEKQILKAMEEYRRLGTTGPGTATSTGFSFQRLMDLIR